jgi:hypothetical protein
MRNEEENKRKNLRLRRVHCALAPATRVFDFGIAKISATTEITKFQEIRLFKD